MHINIPALDAWNVLYERLHPVNKQGIVKVGFKYEDIHKLGLVESISKR
jgi:hypothetical protein